MERRWVRARLRSARRDHRGRFRRKAWPYGTPGEKDTGLPKDRQAPQNRLNHTVSGRVHDKKVMSHAALRSVLRSQKS